MKNLRHSSFLLSPLVLFAIPGSLFGAEPYSTSETAYLYFSTTVGGVMTTVL